jgi:hypothetical protein
MKKTLFILFFLPMIGWSQNFTIQPYLQNANPNSITIMWEYSNWGVSYVEWGNTTALGNIDSTTFEITSSPASLFTATLSGLQANTKYYYRVRTENNTSSIFSFVTRSNSIDEKSINIIAMSDMQMDIDYPQKFKEINNGIIDYFKDNYLGSVNQNLDLVLIPGDLVKTGTNYKHWKDHFFFQSKELFSEVPFYPVLGNHEENSNLYFQYMDLPENGTTGYEEHWWYKDNSNVRIIGLNSNYGYQTQEQLGWLDSILNMTILDINIDFVFAQLHHPHHSELWTPGNTSFTGSVIDLLENFTENSGKPSIHFYGHTHGYSRGESKDHEHLMINVATAGGAIDYWGDWPQADYEEYSFSQDEWGYVLIEVDAGDNPRFKLKRLSMGDANISKYNNIEDSISIRLNNISPEKPMGISPAIVDSVDVNSILFISTPFIDDIDEHGGTQWQISSTCSDFTNPIIDKWIQYQNVYRNVKVDNLNNLTRQVFLGLQSETSYCWRVRYRDKALKWSHWSDPVLFKTDQNELEIKVAPNPIYDKSIVTIPYLKSSVIKIFNISGQLIEEYDNIENSIFTLDRSYFESGIYILKFFVKDNCIATIKFIVL